MTYKSLKDYTDEDLNKLLELNETTELIRLAGYCSEILRRQLKEKKSKDREIQDALFRSLKIDFEKARCVCDPIEFQRCHQRLLYTIADFLINEFDTMPSSSEVSPT